VDGCQCGNKSVRGWIDVVRRMDGSVRVGEGESVSEGVRVRDWEY
jgi:hypothetical protein